MTIPKKIGFCFRFLLLLLAVVSTFSNASVFSGLVLCLGHDGHFELETSAGGKCGTVGEASQEAAFNSSEAESHCGTCTDVSIMASGEDSYRPAQKAQALNLLALAVQPFLASFHLESATPGLLPQPPPLSSPHLESLRTIRLLI